MNPTPYRFFIIEAIKITLFCLLITGIVTIVPFSGNDAILVSFNMAVMSAAATFSPSQQRLSHTSLGSIIIVLSILLGGVVGYFVPTLAKVLTIVYAGLAFLLPRRKVKTNIFVFGALTFLIFSSLPFDLKHFIVYLLDGVLVIVLFTFITWVFNRHVYTDQKKGVDKKSHAKQMSALITVTAMSLAWLMGYLIKIHWTVSHLYWIPLTVLVVIQGPQKENIKIALKRMAVNIVGAIIFVSLLTYIVPNNFWIYFSLLVIFLFLIFALGFSYIGRTLFIELFVLGFTHLLGAYHNIIALDRVMLTIIGGVLVITCTLFYHYTLFRKISA